MIRMIQSMSSGAAKSYFSSSLVQADYYINDQELQGKFHGKLAERLGLQPAASKDDFFALCENKHPTKGGSLTKRTNQERTVGYDINFHCPKSVSLVHALSGDSHLIHLFQSSVHDTMKEIEQDMMTRVRKNGRYEDRKTSEMIWAEFTHQTARPVEGHCPDPHLHSHCFVFNVTWDEQEKQFKAGKFKDIKRDMPYYQARFHKTLSDKLIDAGYRIKQTDKSFEIIGVPQYAIDHFSKRTDEIGRIAEEKGITNARELDALGAKTRSRKQKGRSMEELRQDWRNQIKMLKSDAPYAHAETYNSVIRFPAKTALNSPCVLPQDCVNHAVRHSFERASVMADRRIQALAYRYGIGDNRVSVDQIDSQFNQDDRLLHIQDGGIRMCTTKDVLNEEKQMVDLARRGTGKLVPLYAQAPALQLTGQQAEAVTHILTTPNRISIIRGAAGSGKTTLMKEAVSNIEKAGKKVTVVAPTAQASRGVLKDEGFEHAETVAKLLVDQKLQNSLKDQVLWVDEAGLLGTQDMKELLSIAEKQNARLILGGDTRQHSSVVRGDALRILNTVAGIKTAEVSRIYRQKNLQYRSAVQDLSVGDVRTAFEKLDQMGSIKAVDPLDTSKGLVQDYVATLKKGKSAIIIAPTHKQGEQVTAEIRQTMRQQKMLGKKELKATKLTNLNFTQAQKEDLRSYKPGMMVQFNQNISKIKRGSLWTIEDVTSNQIKMRDSEGRPHDLPLQQADQFDVFEKSTLALSKGDRVMITRNGFDKNNKRLNNGQTMEVASISKKGAVTLQNKASKAKYELDQEFGHIHHAHTITSYAAQGKTVDEVFISQPAATFPATDAKQFYVSISRGRDAAHLYTDDKEALLDHAMGLGDRKSAIELTQGSRSHEDAIFQTMRKDKAYGISKHGKSKQLERTKDTIHYEPDF